MIAIMVKALRMLSSNEKKQLILLLVIIIVTSFVEMLGIASIMPLIGVLSNPDLIQNNKWLNLIYYNVGFYSRHHFIVTLSLVLLVLVMFSNGLKALTIWMTLRYDNHLNYALTRRLLAQYLSRPYVFFLNRNTSEIGKNLLLEVKSVISGCFGAGIQVVSSGIVALLIMGLLVAVEPFIAITIALFIGGTYTVLFLAVRRRLTRIGNEQVKANSMKFKSVSEALTGIKDIKILGREFLFLQKFSKHAKRYADNSIAAGCISSLPRNVLEVMATGSIVVILFYYMSVKGSLSNEIVPLLAVYAFAGYRILPALQQMFSAVATIRLNMAGLDILHRDLSDSHEYGDSAAVLQINRVIQPFPFSSEIEFQNVSFCYPGAKGPAIKGLNLSIMKNSSVGFVGTTGSGKTTAVDLILGLLTPDSGQILVDGKEIKGELIPAWQRNFGYVPQHVFLCDDTVANNIAFGVPDHEVDMVAVVRAARIANLHGFIENKLRNGYETIIGERGIRLSGGQRQRLAIARALYGDPSLLIMDEATNALDGITEVAVMEALRALSGKKTIILVAHRLSTVKDCDIIYVFRDGCVVSEGTYEELIQSSTWFKAATRQG